MRKGIAWFAKVFTGLVVLPSITQPTPAWASDPSIVVTDVGAIQGTVYSNYRAFLGVPFAQPPVGSLRFKAPVLPTAWTGVRPATTYASACPQTGSPDLVNENCLYLNVFTPPSGVVNAPVMVYIHGGGFTGGASYGVDPHNYASNFGAVIVTLQYRLGALGFLAHPALAAESSDSEGNYGLLDQQAAIAWIKRNAAAFGGDASRLTIIGESAGGYSVCANLASPTANGLYQRAIIESGLCTNPSQTQSQAETNGQSFASLAGCSDVGTAADCLRAMLVETLLQAQNTYIYTLPLWKLVHGPVAGGSVMPLSVPDAFSTGAYNHVPIMQGSNHDEYSTFVAGAYDAQGAPLTPLQYPFVIKGGFGAQAKAVLAKYPLKNYPSPDQAYTAVGTDWQFACPAIWADQSIANTNSAPLYAYEFSDPNTPFPVTYSFPLGAYHTGELQFVFNTPYAPFTTSQQQLAAQMMGYWARFAATGNPNGGGAFTWPTFTTASPKMLSFIPAAVTVQTNFYSQHFCDFWTTHGTF